MTMDRLLDDAIREVLHALRDLHRLPRYRDVVPRPGRPASAATLARLQQRVGAPLPPSYLAFLGRHDGYEWLAWPGHMLSVKDASPGGEYWDDLKAWKLDAAEAGDGSMLDGLVVAYLDQPNNWAYLDPHRIDERGEWAVVLHVPGVDPDVFPDLPAFLRGSAARARLSLQWAREGRTPGAG